MKRTALALLLPALARADATIAPTVLEKMTLCTDGKSHYVGLGPDERQITQLWVGDGKKFFPVHAGEGGRMMSGDWFPDPRHVNKGNNASFRGLDLRGWSHVDHDAEKRTCALTCGERVIPLTLVDAAQAKTLLAAAQLVPNPRRHRPYALARDERGTYYYVDRGFTSATERNFRLFVGPKGSLKLQKMTNVVSDSEGDIFSTKTGSLRLILGQGQGTWIAGKKSSRLLWVPVDENLAMIHNELGVYVGERLGTPCDDQ